MGETTREEITASKMVAFIAFLYLIYDAVTYFVRFDVLGDGLHLLFGLIELVFAIIIFISLELVDLKQYIQISIPFQWWLFLIIGIVLVIFGFLGLAISFFTAILLLMIVLIELIEYRASKLVALIGAVFAIFDSIVIFIGVAEAAGFLDYMIIDGVFGLILAIILILTLQDKVDIKIPYVWWVVLIIGFVMFTWISKFAVTANLLYNLPFVGIGGAIILVAFVLLLKDF